MNAPINLTATTRLARTAKKRTGSTLRRFEKHGVRSQWSELPADHPAVIGGRTKYLQRVLPAEHAVRLLKSGHNNRKIGAEVQKGAWRGMPIFTLTLEERATCPSSCQHWRDCFGNKMGWAPRHTHGPALEQRLEKEVAGLARAHPSGFVVRLHVLGDFYDIHYAVLWASLVQRHAALNVFGFTAHTSDSAIGTFIGRARDLLRGRFAIRFSNSDEPQWSTRTLRSESDERPAGSIICPAQTGKTECCATCSLCWATPKPIAFIAH